MGEFPDISIPMVTVHDLFPEGVKAPDIHAKTRKVRCADHDFAWLDELLYGITMDEGEDERGWWETSHGAQFGARKLADLKAAIRHNLFAPDKESWMAGWLTGARDGWPDPSPEAAEYAWNHREDTNRA